MLGRDGVGAHAGKKRDKIIHERQGFRDRRNAVRLVSSWMVRGNRKQVKGLHNRNLSNVHVAM